MKPVVVFFSTFPPRECGIATFTQDLVQALGRVYGGLCESQIVTLNPDDIIHYPYPKKVIFEISQSTQKDYLTAAQKLNQLPEVKLINIQHEFGIFGGERGSYLLGFLKFIKKPVVITLHTVLSTPTKKVREVLRELARYSQVLIVMTNNAKEILQTDYGIPARAISVIPHGIHPLRLVASVPAKAALSFSKNLILSTFGLLSRNKGVEYVIEALPEVVKRFPEVLYLVIGVTHPMVLRNEGEEYRNFLMKKVYSLRLNNYVRFYNRYLPLEELFKFLQATDIYLSPSVDPNQTVSGTLSYAIGAGRPAISTGFPQARDLVTPENGILVGFKNTKAFAQAILKLLADPNLRMQMGKNAYFSTRRMIWPNVALAYGRIFEKFIPALREKEKVLPVVKLTHLRRLTNKFGIIQFAKLTKPDLISGFTVDDNARALLVAALYYEQFRRPLALALLKTYLNFLEYTQQASGYFANFVNSDRSFNMALNQSNSLEDASARALYALAKVSATQSLPAKFRKKATRLFELSFKKNVQFNFPRAVASYIKALTCWLSEKPDPSKELVLRKYVQKLLALYKKHSSTQWQWFEESLTYSNALLAEAMLRAYQVIGTKEYFRIGKMTLDFLIEKTFTRDFFLPVGQNGWYKQGGNKEKFDQQPEEVASMVEALKVKYQITGEDYYRGLMYKAFDWFLGRNILGQVVYDKMSGGCYDGVGRRSVNLNQGAESTISYLLARLVIGKTFTKRRG